MAKIKLFGVEIVVSFTNSDSLVPVYDPTPLRIWPPTKKLAGKRKRHPDEKKKKKSRPVKRRVAAAEDHSPEPPIPAQLLRNIDLSLGPTGVPVFLYEKKLERTDAGQIQNRLFVTKRARFEKFLKEEESRIVYDAATKGLEGISCVDTEGKSYKLGLNWWPSLDMLVINGGWFKLVKANGVEQGDCVQIWGYREMGNLRFAINFNKAGRPNPEIIY